MKSNLLHIPGAMGAVRAIDTDSEEFKARFLVFVYVNDLGDPVAVKLLDAWNGDER